MTTATAPQFDLTQLNDPKVATAVKKSLQDISDQMTIMEGYKATIKEAIKGLSEEHDIPKKTLNWLAKTHHRQSYQSAVDENDTNAIAYTKVFGDD